MSCSSSLSSNRGRPWHVPLVGTCYLVPPPAEANTNQVVSCPCVYLEAPPTNCTHALSPAKVKFLNLPPERTQRKHLRLQELYFKRADSTEDDNSIFFNLFFWNLLTPLVHRSSPAASRSRSQGRPRWCPPELRPPPSQCPRRSETTSASSRTSPAAQPPRCTARRGKGKGMSVAFGVSLESVMGYSFKISH